MMVKKWLVMFGAALAASVARTSVCGPDECGITYSYGDVRVIPAAFASQVDGDRNSSWGHGYFFAFMDVMNFSRTQSREVAFHYAQNCRTPPVVLEPGGAARVALPLHPVYHGWRPDVNLVIDGRFHAEDDNRSMLRLASAQYSRGTSPCVLLSPKISGNAVRYRVDQLRLEETNRYSDNIAFLDAQMPLAEWPDEWLAYSRFDALVMAAEDFDALPPAVAAAIDRYVLAGGRLVIAGREGKATLRGLGKVIYIASAAVEEWSRVDVKNLFWEAREHNNLWRSDYDKGWKKAFAPISGGTMLAVFLLLTAITIGMGPVLMWRLARRDQRIHIYWLAPLAAFATGLVVVLVAFFMDGVTPVLRVNAAAWIDAEAGTVSVLSHAALKTPIGVRGGMVFSRATEVTPLEDQGWRSSSKGRRVEFADVQRFNNAWLPPRTPVAFLLREVKPAPKKTLEIISETDDGLVVANHLGLPLTQIIARGKNARHDYSGRNIPAGGTATFKPAPRSYDMPLEAAQFFEMVRMGEIGSIPERSQLENSYIAIVPGAPFTETFFSVKTKAGGATIIYGAFQKEDLP